eukprot:9194215-Karenia_brevis.AAC.1
MLLWQPQERYVVIEVAKMRECRQATVSAVVQRSDLDFDAEFEAELAQRQIMSAWLWNDVDIEARDT